MITGCPALDSINKARLEGSPFSRVHSPGDPLLLDNTLDAQATAEHLAVLFPEMYALACQAKGWDDLNIVNKEWFIPLIKTYYVLNSNEGQCGATANQLVQRGTRESRRDETREIYLGESFSVFLFYLHCY